MLATAGSETVLERLPAPANVGVRRRIVVGVTSDQTCLVLKGRLRALREADFEVTLVSGAGPLLHECAEAEGVLALEIPIARNIAPLQDLLSLVTLIRLLRRIRPEITDFSTPKAGLLGNLAARLVGVPIRIYTLRGLKLEGVKGWRRTLLWASEWVSARCAQAVLCNSLSLHEETVGLRIAPRIKVHLLGDGSSNGVDVERFSPGSSEVRKRLGICPGEPVIGFVGRLTCDKGVPELVAAFETIRTYQPQARLLFVGWNDAADDALPEDLCRRITCDPRMICTGYVKDVEEYYRAMDVMVLPTHREGFPNVVLEAAASGIPVVTTNVTGARDAVLSEITGLVVQPYSPSAIAEAVMRLLGDTELRQRMGAAARAFATERYMQEHVLRRVVEFFRSLRAEGESERGAGT